MKHDSSKLRIIGGTHRGRKILFSQIDGLRPTPERIRETLFNWLTTYIEGSVCLDAFAGSGALGFEALSRRAKSVIFVDSNIKACRNIKQNSSNFNMENVLVSHQNVISYLEESAQKFDVIFLDPPYQTQLLQQSIDAIQQFDLLQNNSRVYLEYAARSQPPWTPETWKLHRSAKAGDVRAYLYSVES